MSTWTSKNDAKVDEYHISPAVYGMCGKEIGRIGSNVQRNILQIGFELSVDYKRLESTQVWIQGSHFSS